MIGTLPNKTKQFFFALIKLSIVVAASYFMYRKLTHNDNLNFDVFIAFLAKNDVLLTKTVFFLIFLTIFNRFFEILKWRNLVSFIKNISFFEALKQSLAAHPASLFTPNRIGEYGTKAIYFIKPERKRVLLLNLIGNLTQICATLMFGIIGFSLFISNYNIKIPAKIHYKYVAFSIIPTIFVFDVVVKGGIALYLFDFVGVNDLTILSITTLMWILNFVLPSVFGGFYVLNFDYDKTMRSNNLN